MKQRYNTSLNGWLPLAGAVLALVSCGENILGPLNNTEFVLRTVDGVSLPVTVVDEFGGLAWIVTADTIWFEGGSRWRRHSVQHREEGIGGEPLDRETNGTVRLADGVLNLDFDCRDGDCIPPDRLVQNGTVLEMEMTFQHAGTKLIFDLSDSDME